MGKASRRKRERRERRAQGLAAPSESKAQPCPGGCEHALSEHYRGTRKTEGGTVEVVLRCRRTQVRRDEKASEKAGKTVMAEYHCPCVVPIGQLR